MAPNSSEPALIVVAPVYVLLEEPDNTTVPVVVFVRPTAPAKIAEIVPF